MKTIITGLLSKAYNLDKGKIAELLKDGENELSAEQEKEILDKILEIDTSRISTVKENAEKNVNKKEFIEQGYNKAKAEVLSKFESELKTKFGVESDKTGQELVDFIVSEKSTKGGELNDDAIKRSRIYQDLESKSKTDLKALEDDYKKQIQDINDGIVAEKVFSEVSNQALSIFNELNPILPKNKQVADNQVNNFVNMFKDYKYERQGDRTVIMDKDGKVLDDGHGNSKDFKEFVKEKASSLFEFTANNGGSGSGNGNGGAGGSGSGGSGTSHPVPKNFEELEKLMADDSISSEDKTNLINEYEKAQKV